jgi:hypothetical protein
MQRAAPSETWSPYFFADFTLAERCRSPNVDRVSDLITLGLERVVQLNRGSGVHRSPWQNAFAERMIGRFGENAWTMSWFSVNGIFVVY